MSSWSRIATTLRHLQGSAPATSSRPRCRREDLVRLEYRHLLFCPAQPRVDSRPSRLSARPQLASGKNCHPCRVAIHSARRPRSCRQMPIRAAKPSSVALSCLQKTGFGRPAWAVELEEPGRSRKQIRQAGCRSLPGGRRRRRLLRRAKPRVGLQSGS